MTGEYYLWILTGLQLLLLIGYGWMAFNLSGLKEIVYRKEGKMGDEFAAIWGRMSHLESKLGELIDLHQSFIEEMTVHNETTDKQIVTADAQNKAITFLGQKIDNLREEILYFDADLESAENRIMQLEYKPSPGSPPSSFTPPPPPPPSASMRRLRRRVTR